MLLLLLLLLLLLVLLVLLPPTVWTNCMRGTKLLFFPLFFHFFEGHPFFPMSMPALNSFCSKGGPMKQHNLFIKKYVFAGHFLVRLWGICSIRFCILLCIYFQALGSNFTKNPFCYFRISSLISQSPKNPIICQSVQKCLPNSSVLCKTI